MPGPHAYHMSTMKESGWRLWKMEVQSSYVQLKAIREVEIKIKQTEVVIHINRYYQNIFTY